MPKRNGIPFGMQQASARRKVIRCDDCRERLQHATNLYHTAKAKGKHPLPVEAEKYICDRCQVYTGSENVKPLQPVKEKSGPVVRKKGESRKAAIKKTRHKNRKKGLTGKANRTITKGMKGKASREKNKPIIAIWCATFADEVGGIFETEKPCTKAEAKFYFASLGLVEYKDDTKISMGGSLIEHIGGSRRVKWKAKYDIWAKPGTILEPEVN